MERHERDDFMYALGQTLKFYGKTLEDGDFAFWYSALGDRSVSQIKTALKEYLKVGKFAPRPANIMELINNARPAMTKSLPPPPTTTCPPEIADAWRWFIARTTQDTSMSGLFQSSEVMSMEQQEKYLHIVNHEAQRLNQPDAIPSEYKLAEVWAGVAA